MKLAFFLIAFSLVSIRVYYSWAGLDRNRRDALPDSSVTMQVIRGHRLLDPRQVEFRQTANTLNCARDRLRLVVVHHQLDIRPNDPSRLADDPHILFKTCSADLDFDRFESALNGALQQS